MQYEKSKRIGIDWLSDIAGAEAAAEFQRFNEYLSDETGTRLESLYQLRFHEIAAALDRYGIKTVYEMGSGRTTYLFNLYPGLEVVSYEQDEMWRETLLRYFRDARLPVPDIRISGVERYGKGGRFAELEAKQCDLLYIDGPYVERAGERFSTHTGKPAYHDFETIFEVGLPRVIMVEGRTDTVDEILASPHCENYNFAGELTWALERNRYLHALRLNRHSVFVRKQ